jgi:hypothetical protein
MMRSFLRPHCVTPDSLASRINLRFDLPCFSLTIMPNLEMTGTSPPSSATHLASVGALVTNPLPTSLCNSSQACVSFSTDS